jgi:hypothetical protein
LLWPALLLLLLLLFLLHVPSRFSQSTCQGAQAQLFHQALLHL